MLTLGKYGCANTDEFPENFQRGGGGVIFNPKIHVADFGNFSYYLALVPPCTYSIISIIKKLSRYQHIIYFCGIVHDTLPSPFFPIHLAKGADLLSESLLVENYWCCPFTLILLRQVDPMCNDIIAFHGWVPSFKGIKKHKKECKYRGGCWVKPSSGSCLRLSVDLTSS